MAYTSAVDTSKSELQRLFAGMRAAYLRNPMPSYQARRKRLLALKRLMEENETALAMAMSEGFGNRSLFETELVGVVTSLAELKHTLRHLRGWMRPKRVRTPLYLFPARARIERQPVGVVGIISPWNYPIFLSIPPACGALAAGNRVLLKPSELTPHFNDLLQRLVADNFAEDEFRVIVGGKEVGEELAKLPLDHLFFTGSTRVGQAVARAAADNLTPLTLELGGKSPAVIGSGNAGDLRAVARSIAFGKLLNAGQTCVAPDYVFLPRTSLTRFAALLGEEAERLYPDAANNPQYTSMIADHFFERLVTAVEEVRGRGTEVITVGNLDASKRRMPMQIVLDPPPDAKLMRQEIFGPVLPLLPYDSLNEVISRINAGPRPLALYYFGHDRAEQRQILDYTVSGGVTINDVLWHIAHPNLPFGGVGESGHGAYHGEFSFRRFSHEKAVFDQSSWALTPLLHPPHGKTARWVLNIVRKLI